MVEGDKSKAEPSKPPIFIVSGGKGLSGEQLTRTALAQFIEADLPIIVVPHVQEVDQIKSAVDQAVETGGTIIHTLVDSKLRRSMIRQARDRNVVAIDLIGQVLSRLAKVLGQEPLGQPGEYWKVHQTYFERVAKEK